MYVRCTLWLVALSGLVCATAPSRAQQPLRATPSPGWTVTVSERVDGDAGVVWGLVGTMANLLRWNPNVRRCEMRVAHGATVRVAHFPDWWIAERLLHRDPALHIIDYRVSASSRPDIVGSRAQIEVVAAGPHRTIVRWRSRLPDGSPGPAAQLGSYYHMRLAQLRAALTRPGRAVTCSTDRFPHSEQE